MLVDPPNYDPFHAVWRKYFQRERECIKQAWKVDAKRAQSQTHQKHVKNTKEQKAVVQTEKTEKTGRKKQSPLLELEFINRLAIKAFGYYVDADKLWDHTGERYSRDIVSDPLFVAVRCHRLLYPQLADFKEFITGAPSNIRELWDRLNQQSELLKAAYVKAAGEGDIPMLMHLFKLSILYEKRGGGAQIVRKPGETTSWHFYAAYCAYQSLDHGEIPSRPELLEAAIQERATDMLPSDLPAKTKAVQLNQKIHELEKEKPSPRHWRTILRDLGLRALPKR